MPEIDFEGILENTWEPPFMPIVDISDPGACCDDEVGVVYERHDYGEHGTDDACTRCGYEIELCAVAVYMESYEHGGEWTGCDEPVQWWANSGKRRPFPLCDRHKQEQSAADLTATFTAYDPATAERTWISIEDLCELPVCHHSEDEECAARDMMWLLSADL